MTKIEWTDETWTPIRARNRETGGVGHFCVHVSPGCQHCYAERMQPRFGNPVRFAAQDRERVDLFLDEKVLAKPLHWRRSRMIFVCSMTDLFADFVPDEWIDKVMAVMALCPQHTFQVLSKRPARMQNYLSSPKTVARIAALVEHATHGQRNDLAAKRAIRDRSQWANLAHSEASRARRDEGRRLSQRGENQSVPASASGISDQGRLSSSHGDNRWSEDRHRRSSHSLGESERPDSRGSDDQSQKRSQGGQPAEQSRARDLFGTAHSRHRGLERKSEPTEGQQTSEDVSSRGGCSGDTSVAAGRLNDQGDSRALRHEDQGDFRDLQPEDLEAHLDWPLPNMWAGTSCEDQARADERIPHLLDTPAAVRFVSAEPLLSHLDLSPWLGSENENHEGGGIGLSGSSDGRTGNRRSGHDLASVGASLESMGEDDGGDPMPTTPSGARRRRLSSSTRDDRPQESVGMRAPVGVAPLSRADTGRAYDQSQGRAQETESSRQPGARDHIATSAARDPIPGMEAREKLSWVIVGGESGPNARPMHPDWARSIRDQCQAAGVPFFMKQMTKKAPIPDDLQIREWPHADT